MSERERVDFFIVGIGASAGGLQALQDFFSKMPKKNPAAFVVIQHLSPDFESMMDELLAKYTGMSIVKVTKPTKVHPNHVYLMSPKQNLELINGSLQPRKPDAKNKPNLPIDLFFNSLGREWGINSVGIILTGTGTDGSRGIKTIKEQGGIVMVQDPDTAKFDGMPNAAVLTGLADYVLELPEMAQEVRRIITRFPETPASAEELPSSEREHLVKILQLVAQETNIDFSLYKEATILRRMQKRMHITNTDTLEHYYEMLSSDTKEVERLSNEFLIGVSSFFRDGHPWEVFYQEVLPSLMEKLNKDDNKTIRIWVAGCSTGEEAYTIGMLVDDYCSQHHLSPDYKIFGSDIDKRAIYAAGLGVYGSNIADTIPDHYLNYYFERSGNTYRVKKFFRDHFVFASQNIIADPPFIRMDVVSCRNVLIYLNPEVQQTALANFHFSLNKDGFLILGKSENIRHLLPFFTSVGKSVNIFQNRIASAGKLPNHHTKPASQTTSTTNPSPQDSTALTASVLNSLMSEAYDEAGALVNSNYQILHVQGNVDRYFHFPKKSLRMHLEDVLGKDEYLLVKSGVREALNRKKSVYYPEAMFKKGRSKRMVDLRFKAIRSAALNEKIVYIEFRNDRKTSGSQKKPTLVNSEEDNRQIDLLEREVDEKQRLIQTLREDLDTHSEELQTTNEELLASNEELQSSNEELQSVNEELYTLNSELEDKVKEVTRANNDIINVFNSTEIATIFIDQNFLIRRLTPNVSKIINITEKDIGRSIDHFTTKLKNISLSDLTQQVLQTKQPLEREVDLIIEECCYLMRILPYREADGTVDGLIITFVDITEVKDAQTEVKNARAFAESIVDTVIDPLLVLNNNLKVISANPAFYATFKTSIERTSDQHIYDLGNGQWNQPDLRRLLEEVIPEKNIISDYKIEHSFPTIGHRIMNLNAVAIPQLGKTPALILLIIRDITEKEERRKQLQETAERLNLVLHTSKVGTWEWDLQRQKVLGDTRLHEIFDLPTSEEIAFEDLFKKVHPDDRSKVSQALHDAIEQQKTYYAEFRIKIANGEVRHLIGRGNLLSTEEGEVRKMLGINLDITDQKRAEEENVQYGKLLEESYNEIYIFDAETLQFINVNRGARQNLGYSMEELSGFTPLDIKPDYTQQSFAQLIEPLKSGSEEIVTFETVHQRKDGSQYNVLINLQLSTFRDKKVFMAIVQDTTEQARAKEQLRKSEERLAVAITGTADGIWDWPDIQQDYVWWSPRFYELIGLQNQEIESSLSNFSKITHPKDISIWEKALDEHIKSGKPYDVSVRLRHQEKAYRWFRIRGKVVRDRDGNPVRMGGSISDVHNQKMAEAKLKKTNRELRIANEYLDNFVFTAAHDLRAPVANLKSLSGLLQTNNGQDHRVVEKIDQSVDRLEGTLRGIIRILDIQQAEGEEHASISFEKVLKSVCKDLEEKIDKTNAVIRSAFSVDSIQYVEFYLASILKNLISNAIKYQSDEQPPQISIHTENKNGYICLKVQDNGVGIDLHRYGKKIFRPFERLHRSIEGLGIGLHIIKTIVEKNGGYIEVQSQPGEGTTFLVYLKPYTYEEKNTTD